MAGTPAPRVSGPQLTIREAATWLDPPITTEQLAALIRVASVPPTGQRRNGRRGRPENTYEAATLMELHAAICRWLLRVSLALAQSYVAIFVLRSYARSPSAVARQRVHRRWASPWKGTIMFAIIAAILFGVALLLHLISARGDIAADLIIAGFLAIALHLALGLGLPWRRA